MSFLDRINSPEDLKKLAPEELTALAEGAPLTDWRVPDEPLRPPPTTRFV